MTKKELVEYLNRFDDDVLILLKDDDDDLRTQIYIIETYCIPFNSEPKCDYFDEVDEESDDSIKAIKLCASF